jgi:hypothetical protein
MFCDLPSMGSVLTVKHVCGYIIIPSEATCEAHPPILRSLLSVFCVQLYHPLLFVLYGYVFYKLFTCYLIPHSKTSVCMLLSYDRLLLVHGWVNARQQEPSCLFFPYSSFVFFLRNLSSRRCDCFVYGFNSTTWSLLQPDFSMKYLRNFIFACNKEWSRLHVNYYNIFPSKNGFFFEARMQ